MPVAGRFNRATWGADGLVHTLAGGGLTTLAMAALNAGWCARLTAPDSRDIKSVWINWATVATPGTVQVRAETIDATTGKPSGTLYDASASKSFTPVAGWQNPTFDVLPTAGLTAGTEYAVVLLTTTGGTTQTLNAYVTSGANPSAVLTAADGTTRANFAEVAGATPVMVLVFEDNSEEALALSPFAVRNQSNNIFGTVAAALKFTVPAGLSFLVAGVEATFGRTGTPAGDVRSRILDAAGAAVSGTTLTLDKDSLTNVSGSRRLRQFYPAVVALPAGTYRLVFDSLSSVNSSNTFRLVAATARSSATVPSGFLSSTTADITAGTVAWTDTAADFPAAGLVLDDVIGTPVIMGGARRITYRERVRVRRQVVPLPGPTVSVPAPFPVMRTRVVVRPAQRLPGRVVALPALPPQQIPVILPARRCQHTRAYPVRQRQPVPVGAAVPAPVIQNVIISAPRVVR